MEEKSKKNFEKLNKLFSENNIKQLFNLPTTTSAITSTVISIIGDSKIIKKIQEILNDEEIIKSLIDHNIIKNEMETIQKIKDTFNSLK
jgi:hypothetical protein